MNLFRLTALFAAAFMAVFNPAAAQWQTPTHSVPLGKGAGVVGFGAAAPGASGSPLLSNGAGADPSFRPLLTATPLSAAHTITTADCGLWFLPTVSSNGATYAVTFPAATSFPNDCAMVVTAPGNRGVGIVIPGTRFASNAMLWPNQRIKVTVESGGYLVEDPGPWVQSSALCVWKGGSGSDLQDGLDGSPATTGGAGCLANIGTCVNLQYTFIRGNFTCNLAGAANASFLEDNVQMGGQLTGSNLLTFNVNAPGMLWQANTSCFTAADGAELAVNILNAFKAQCNLNNLTVQGFFKGHQANVLDFLATAATFTYIPGGIHDSLYANDADGRATINGTFVLGDGSTRALGSIIDCEQKCGVTVSGTFAFAGNFTLQTPMIVNNLSFVANSATYGTPTATGTAINVDGNSVLRTSGASFPGGTVTTSNGGRAF